MPICEADPWRLQYFEHAACPADVDIPTDDPDSWRWYPRHRWVYDTFALISYDGKLIPWAAESWQWVDSTHINIKLRKGMKFHDGKLVTVDDALHSASNAHDFTLKLEQAGIKIPA